MIGLMSFTGHPLRPPMTPSKQNKAPATSPQVDKQVCGRQLYFLLILFTETLVPGSPQPLLPSGL